MSGKNGSGEQVRIRLTWFQILLPLISMAGILLVVGFDRATVIKGINDLDRRTTRIEADYVPRKEYDERHVELQKHLARIEDMLKEIETALIQDGTIQRKRQSRRGQPLLP